MTQLIRKQYQSDPIKEELKKFSPQDLRRAANFIDRDLGNYPPINMLALSKKLDALDAELTYTGKETGLVTFRLDCKKEKVVRFFESISELTMAVNLGPLDLHWKDNLFIKTQQGVFKCIIDGKSDDGKKIRIYSEQINLYKDIFINGAEKILCNSSSGLTAGQIKLEEVRMKNKF